MRHFYRITPAGEQGSRCPLEPVLGGDPIVPFFFGRHHSGRLAHFCA